MAAPIRELARAKINLDLHVTARRADGYHLIDSLMAFTAFGDLVEIASASDLHLTLIGPFARGLATDADNLVLRAARGLQALAATFAGAALTVTKSIPVAAGLGGGSADAAATLRGLCRLWGVAPPAAGLEALAASLGADVPACLDSRPVCARGIGEQLAPVSLPPAVPLLLVNPGVPLVTAEVFRRLRPPFAPPPAPWRGAADVPALAAALRDRRNDLEAPAIAACPAVSEVLAALRAQPGCLLARMSGSGATCFGLFADLQAADRAAGRLAIDQPRWWLQCTHLDNGCAAG